MISLRKAFNKVEIKSKNYYLRLNRLSPEHLHRLYVFSLVWGIGAFLENEDRDKYNDFIRTKFTSFDLPEATEDNKSLFDFYVTIEGRNLYLIELNFFLMKCTS